MDVIRHLKECIMLDTVAFRVNNVNVMLPTEIAINGESRLSKGALYSSSGRRTLKFRHVKKHNRLEVEGSAAMHFQGHNIVGTNDLRMTVIAALKAINAKSNLNVDWWQAYALMLGQDIEITRLDTPALLRVPDGLSRAAVVNGLAMAGLRSGLTVTLHQNETFYYEQHSQIVALKGYLKDVQMQHMKKKAEPADSPNKPALLDLASSTIRIEPVYRKKYFETSDRFEKRLPALRDLSPTVLATMFVSLLEKYNLRGNLRRSLTDEELWALPRKYRGIVACWQRGSDLLKYFDGDQGAFDRYRRALKKSFSIDIKEPPPGEIEVNLQVGDILHPANFVLVADAIRRDPALVHTFDLHGEWNRICDCVDLHRGISRAIVDMYEPPEPARAPQMRDVDFD